MQESPEFVGITLCALYARLIALKDYTPDLDARQAEAIPDYGLWRDHERIDLPVGLRTLGEFVPSPQELH